MNNFYLKLAFSCFLIIPYGKGYSSVEKGSMQFSAVVIITELEHIYDGSAKRVFVTTIPGGLPIKVTYNGNTQAPTDAGSYAVHAEVTARFWEGSDDEEMVINPAEAGIAFENTVQQYDGKEKKVNVVTDPEGLQVEVAYQPASPVIVGTYKVTATIKEKNYTGSANGNLTIEKKPVDITLSNLVHQYDGSPKTVQTVTNPSNIPLKITYDGTDTPPSASGQYNVVAVPKDQSNYSGEGKGTLTINSAPEAISSPVVELDEDQQSYTLDLKQVFSDPDAWDNLTYSITGNSNEKLFTSVQVNGSNLNMSFAAEEDGAAILVIKATDQYGASAQTNVTVSLSPINDPPNLEIDDKVVTFVPVRDKPAPILEWVKITDPDNENMTGAQVLFNPRTYDRTADILLCEDHGNIRCTFSREAGILNMIGIDTKENYEEALKLIRYDNRSEKKYTENRVLTIYVDDGEASSNFVKKEIDVKQGFVELGIPTAFTPNEDVVNDTWKIKNLERYPDAVISVYNRLGQLVFRSTEQQREWNGEYQGHRAPAGSYLYEIAIDSYNKRFTGYITVVR